MTPEEYRHVYTDGGRYAVGDADLEPTKEGDSAVWSRGWRVSEAVLGCFFVFGFRAQCPHRRDLPALCPATGPVLSIGSAGLVQGKCQLPLGLAWPMSVARGKHTRPLH